jgi:hypothetical protein
VARMGDKGHTYRLLMGEPEGKRPLGRPRRRWEVKVSLSLYRHRQVLRAPEF